MLTCSTALNRVTERSTFFGLLVHNRPNLPKMQKRNLRYVADIEVPEGVVSIDCEVRSGEKTKILFILNNSTCEGDGNPLAGDFRGSLESRGEILIETETDDPKAFIRKTLSAAYGLPADITLTDTDTD